MSCYTPVFGSIFSGTLCGQWPDVAVWIFFLALADWKGEVDCTPEYIATLTGMPLADLLQGIERLCSPDARSRSKAVEGRRLVPIDPDRKWGWRIVNIRKYRDKASGIDQRNDGRHAEKNRRYRQRHGLTAGGRIPTERPRETGETAERPTQTQTQTHTENRKTALRLPDLPDGIDRNAWAEWVGYRRERSLPMSSRALAQHIRALLPYLPEIQRAMIEQSIANGRTGLSSLEGDGARTPKRDLLADWAPPFDR